MSTRWIGGALRTSFQIADCRLKEISICHRCGTLPSGLFGCFRQRSLGGILSYVTSDDDDIAAKWGRCFDREARAQDAEAFRGKRNGNE
ncbi:MAG: hypothetical protein DME77_06345 [Verrucomicrobia bacterium]|nr:MAG: hypothetical protein DME77_06345 [Verrucomicrobiota bacterium]